MPSPPPMCSDESSSKDDHVHTLPSPPSGSSVDEFPSLEELGFVKGFSVSHHQEKLPVLTENEEASTLPSQSSSSPDKDLPSPEEVSLEEGGSVSHQQGKHQVPPVYSE